MRLIEEDALLDTTVENYWEKSISWKSSHWVSIGPLPLQSWWRQEGLGQVWKTTMDNQLLDKPNWSSFPVLKVELQDRKWSREPHTFQSWLFPWNTGRTDCRRGIKDVGGTTANLIHAQFLGGRATTPASILTATGRIQVEPEYISSPLGWLDPTFMTVREYKGGLRGQAATSLR